MNTNKNIICSEESHFIPGDSEIFEYENCCQKLTDADSDLKKTMAKIIDLRVQAADLEVSWTTYHNPELQTKLNQCRELQQKCEKIQELLVNDIPIAQHVKVATENGKDN